MTSIFRLIQRMATFRMLAVLFGLYVLVFGAIIITLFQLTELTGGIGILDFDRGYSIERVNEVFSSYGTEGMILFTRIQLLDLLNPAIYSLFLASIIHLLWRDHNIAWASVLPLVAGLLDYMENLTLFLLARNFPDLSIRLVAISSTLSIIKNIALFSAIIALLIGLVLFIVGRFRERSS